METILQVKLKDFKKKRLLWNYRDHSMSLTIKFVHDLVNQIT